MSRQSLKTLNMVRAVVDAANEGQKCLIMVPDEAHAAMIENKYGLSLWPNIEVRVTKGPSELHPDLFIIDDPDAPK